ncbi:MAG: hypothetical protein AAF909_05485 [Pseudomonadota bacterium]
MSAGDREDPRSSGAAEPELLAQMGGGALRRAPQPEKAYGLSDEVRAQLAALELDPARPLLALDADEVLLEFSTHLGRWMEGEGWRLDLTSYRLEGAIRRIDGGRPAEGWEVGKLINGFFDAQVEEMTTAPGAAAAVDALGEIAQVIVLTNVPFVHRQARARCLAAQGISAPVVANSGGKGRALRWLWDRTEAPMAFVDDAEPQLFSAKSRAPDVFRLHFIASDHLRRVAGDAPSANAQADSWPEAVTRLRAALAA